MIQDLTPYLLLFIPHFDAPEKSSHLDRTREDLSPLRGFEMGIRSNYDNPLASPLPIRQAQSTLSSIEGWEVGDVFKASYSILDVYSK